MIWLMRLSALACYGPSIATHAFESVSFFPKFFQLFHNSVLSTFWPVTHAKTELLRRRARLMDVENAKAMLKFVAAKEQSRAAKRKAAAETAAAASVADGRKQCGGGARAAKRAKVAASAEDAASGGHPRVLSTLVSGEGARNGSRVTPQSRGIPTSFRRRQNVDEFMRISRRLRSWQNFRETSANPYCENFAK